MLTEVAQLTASDTTTVLGKVGSKPKDSSVKDAPGIRHKFILIKEIRNSFDKDKEEAAGVIISEEEIRKDTDNATTSAQEQTLAAHNMPDDILTMWDKSVITMGDLHYGMVHMEMYNNNKIEFLEQRQNAKVEVVAMLLYGQVEDIQSTG